MAQFIAPAAEPLPGYAGLDSIFQYTNWDGRWTPFNCGQAAACTFLTHLGKLDPAEERAGAIMQTIEQHFPPDNACGYLGTSRRRVERICRSHGIPLTSIGSESALRAALGAKRPAIVMLSVSGPRFWRWTMPSGHWMVAYGCDAEHVYLTNWGRMSWPDFRKGWNGLVPRVVSMRRRALVARSEWKLLTG